MVGTYAWCAFYLEIHFDRNLHFFMFLSSPDQPDDLNIAHVFLGTSPGPTPPSETRSKSNTRTWAGSSCPR